MATVIIQKRETKTGNRYDVKYADPFTGRKKHYKTYRKYKEANAMANDLRSTLDLGKVPKREKLRPMTFGDVSRSLKKEWASRLISNQISPKTHEDYVIWLNVLNRTFGNKLLCQISKNEIVQFRDNLAGTLSNVSSNKYLSILKKVFRHGLVLWAVTVDPSKDLPALSEKMHVRNRFILPEELSRLVEASRKTRAKFYMPAIIYLGAEHGASKQEIIKLNWHDIKFDYAEYGMIRFFRTKNKRERTEFLMPRAKKALLEWRGHLSRKRKIAKMQKINSDRVFCRIDGTPLKRFDSAWRAFNHGFSDN